MAYVMDVLALLLSDQLKRLHYTDDLDSLHAFLQVIDKVKEENFRRDGAHALLLQEMSVAMHVHCTKLRCLSTASLPACSLPVCATAVALAQV